MEFKEGSSLCDALYGDLYKEIDETNRLELLKDENDGHQKALKVLEVLKLLRPFSPLDSRKDGKIFSQSLEENNNHLVLLYNYKRVPNPLISKYNCSTHGSGMGNSFTTTKDTIRILSTLVKHFGYIPQESEDELPVIFDPYFCDGQIVKSFNEVLPEFRVHNGLYIQGRPISQISVQRFSFCTQKERIDYQKHLQKCNITLKNIQVMYFNMRYSDREDIPHILEFIKCAFRYNTRSCYFIVSVSYTHLTLPTPPYV